VLNAIKNWTVINLGSLLPATVALIVMAVALQTMFVSHGVCPPANRPAELWTNPVLCPDRGIMHRLLDDAVRAQLVVPDKPAAALINLESQRADLQKGVPDAAAEAKAAKAKLQTAQNVLKDAQAALDAAQAALTAAEQKRQQAARAAAAAASAPRLRAADKRGRGSSTAAADLATAERNKADAVAAKVKAEAARVDAKNKVADAEKDKAEADTKLTAASQKLTGFDKAVERAVSASTLREAQARLLWFGSFGSSLVVALGTIFAMLWVLATVTDDHVRYMPLNRWETKIGRGFQLLAVFLGSLVALYLFGHVAYRFTNDILFDGKAPAWSWLPWSVPNGLLTFDDNLQSYVFGSDKAAATPAALLGGGPLLLKEGNWMVIAAVVFIAAAVTAILYQHPAQVSARKKAPPAMAAEAADAYEEFLAKLKQYLKKATAPPPDPPPARLEQTLEQVAAATTKANDDYRRFLETLTVPDAYIQFLARCFRRLSVAIYFGSVLLVISVGRISAQYGWPAALLDPDETAEQPIKTHLVTALKGVADQFAIEYGMIFTLLLFSLFLPAWVVLRRRAWEVARAHKPDATQECQQKWLDSQGLGFTSVQHAAQLFAALAPAGAGTIIAVVKNFTGG
jgi:Tfp pilus assembly protein PilE